ncbi:TPA: DUF1378 family protein [Escherichia coli]|nr:DUF1378 family protein [Escherichia coli]
MTFLQLILLYFCTVVSALYLLSGGYKVIRNYVQGKINAAAAEQLKASGVVQTTTAQTATTGVTATQSQDLMT